MTHYNRSWEHLRMALIRICYVILNLLLSSVWFGQPLVQLIYVAKKTFHPRPFTLVLGVYFSTCLFISFTMTSPNDISHHTNKYIASTVMHIKHPLSVISFIMIFPTKVLSIHSTVNLAIQGCPFTSLQTATGSYSYLVSLFILCLLSIKWD